MDERTAARDAGLRRVSVITRGALAAGLALTGVFSALAARAFAGRDATASASVSSGTGATPTTSTTVAPSSSDDDGTDTLQPYTSAPLYSTGGRHVTSGGS